MTALDEHRVVDGNDVLPLGPGDGYRVLAGSLFVFVAPRTPEGPGRRIPLTEAGPGRALAGVEVADADVFAVGLPGTEVAVIAPEPAAAEEFERAVTAALAIARQDDNSAAEHDAAVARHDARLVDDALLGLAAVVPGEKPDPFDSEDLPSDVAVVDYLARQIGLRPVPLLLRRAMADVEVSGRDAVTALAAAAGAAVRRVDLPAGWWRREGPPLMLRDSASGRHAAAVWRRGSYHVWEQRTGLGPVLDASTAPSWDRAAIVLEPLLDPHGPAGITDLLRLALRGSRNSIRLVVVLTAVVGMLAAVIPVVVGALTSTIEAQTRSTLLVVAAALVAIAAGDTALRAVRVYALMRIRGRGVSVAATAMWDRLLRLPMSWQNSRTVASRMADANSVDTASMVMGDSVVTSLLDVATVAGALFGVFTVSWPLALALTAFLAVRAAVDTMLVRRAARLARTMIDVGTESQAVTLGMVVGVNRLRVSGATARAFALWAEQQARTTEVEVRQRRLSVVQQTTGVLWPTLGLALLFVVTAATGTDVGALVTAQTSLVAATTALAAAVAAVGAGLAASSMLRRSVAVLQAQPESGTGQEVARLAGAIDLRDVVFGYRDDGPPVLDGVNLSVPPGAHVAVVGPSGCGKTTLLRVVLGLEDPRSGIVSFDGRDLSALDRSSVRRQIGAVMQSSQLLPGTIRDNVDLGRGLSTEEIWAALEHAAVADDVRAMPMGLSTVVVEGVGTISGGQRQRVLLARALAGRPRILILDEATSALDNVSQSAVVASLDTLDITRLVVAHRLSTIEKADSVVMLDGGRVVAHGTFDELMAAPGPFRTLVERQRL